MKPRFLAMADGMALVLSIEAAHGTEENVGSLQEYHQLVRA